MWNIYAYYTVLKSSHTAIFKLTSIIAMRLQTDVKFHGSFCHEKYHEIFLSYCNKA